MEWVRFAEEDKDSEITKPEKMYAETLLKPSREGLLHGGRVVKGGRFEGRKVQT